MGRIYNISPAATQADIAVSIAAIPPGVTSSALPLGTRYTKFTSTGQTLVVPAGVTLMLVRMRGGGGGGGGSYWSTSPTSIADGGGGGGGGEVKDEWVPVTPGDTLTATIGAGGNGGNAAATSGSSGTQGSGGGTTQLTDTTTSTLLATANGGGGGGQGTPTNPGEAGLYAGAPNGQVLPVATTFLPGSGSWTPGSTNYVSPPFMGVVGGGCGGGSSGGTGNPGGLGGPASTVATNALVVSQWLLGVSQYNTTKAGLPGVTATTPGCGGGGAGGVGNGFSGANLANGGNGAKGLIELWY